MESQKGTLMTFLFIPAVAEAARKIALFRREQARATAQIAFPAEQGSTKAEVPIVSLRRC